MDRQEPVTRTADAKGRITLGESFANRTVIVERLPDGDVLIRPARFVPAQEAWLYENPKALGAVRRGLKNAREGKLNKGPDLKAGARLAAKLKEA